MFVIGAALGVALAAGACGGGREGGGVTGSARTGAPATTSAVTTTTPAPVAPATAAVTTAAPTPSGARLPRIDVHTHFGPTSAPRAIELMNRYGIDVAVNLSGGTAGRGLPEQLAAARAYPGRIVVFANLDWREPLAGPGWGKRMAAGLVRAHELGAAGLKIPKTLGLGYVDHTGALIAVDDPELDPVFQAAGELNMPVAIHTGDPIAFWAPPTTGNERYEELSSHPEWSFYGLAVPDWESLFSALERRIARHPRTTFISVHFGNAPEDPDRVAALLDRYPNLHVDTAARIPEIGRRPPEGLRALFIAHESRILFGTDLGVGRAPDDLMLGSTGPTPPTPADVERFFSATWRFFETRDVGFEHPTPIQGKWTISGIGLPEATLRKIYAENAARLLGVAIPGR